jgi:hypothetical protein
MKHIRRFNIVNENTSYKLPASTGDSDKDEEVFLFSTEDEKKSVILNMFLDKINSSKIFGNPEDFSVKNLTCEYKPGSELVTYTLEFTTPDENLKKETDGSVEEHQWEVIAQVPSDIISKINSGELTPERGEEEIAKEISWTYRDGMDASIGGWQLKSIDAYKQRNQWLAKEKEKDSKNPKWIQRFSSWITDKFA